MKRFRERLTYANVVATLALVVAVGGGTALALVLPKNSVKSKHIAPKNVKNSDIAAAAVTASKIGAGAVGNSQLAGGAVDTGKLADNAVNSAQIANSSIQTDDLANESVTASKLANSFLDSAPGTVPTNQTIFLDLPGGPAVTFNAPPDSFAEFAVAFDYRTGGAGGCEVVAVLDGNQIGGAVGGPPNLAFQTVFTSVPPQLVSSGSHTITLRYRDQDGGVAPCEFRNRKIWVQVISD